MKKNIPSHDSPDFYLIKSRMTKMAGLTGEKDEGIQ